MKPPTTVLRDAVMALDCTRLVGGCINDKSDDRNHPEHWCSNCQLKRIALNAEAAGGSEPCTLNCRREKPDGTVVRLVRCSVCTNGAEWTPEQQEAVGGSEACDSPSPRTAEPLRLVTRHTQMTNYVLDTLECGHEVADYDNRAPKRRRCRECPTESPAEGV